MKLALIGDIALFGKLSYRNNPNLARYFEDVANYLSTMDFVVGNLETPFSIKKRTYGAKSAYICSDVENIEVLKQLHIDAVTLANNHIFDYGKEGYELTKKLLRENAIEFFGVEGLGLHKQIDNNKLAFEGFCCYSTNPLQCVPYGDYGVNEFEVGEARSLLLQHAKDGSLPIAAIHAGIEHVNFPSLDTIKVANLLGEDIPYVYYGHHPHVLQSIEKRGESLIAYSLGNFCFDDVYTSASPQPLIRLSENNRTSCILVIEIENNHIIQYETIPIFIGKDKLKVNSGTGREDIGRYGEIMAQKNESEYTSMRSLLISEYISGRKQGRNLLWYLKRLRPRYYRILKNTKHNQDSYNQNVTKYLVN